MVNDDDEELRKSKGMKKRVLKKALFMLVYSSQYSSVVDGGIGALEQGVSFIIWLKYRNQGIEQSAHGEFITN